MSSSKPSKPLVLLPACNRMLGEHPFHVAGRKYVRAVRLAGALPLVVPWVEDTDVEALLDLADGVLLTGSPANVHPSRFGEAVHNPSLPLDTERDGWTLALVPRILARGIPLLGICRGAQEVNVALGGSLYQAVQEAGPYDDHRSDDDADAAVQYGPAHPVDAVPGGLLHDIVGQTRFDVNSIHGQAVKQLASGLRVEARAPDGLIEAFSKPDAPGFNLCVQWHPEWRADENPVSLKLFQRFGDAVRSYRQRQRHAVPDRVASA